MTRTHVRMSIGMVLVLGLFACAPDLVARRGSRGAVQGVAEGLGDVDPVLLARLRRLYLGDASLQRLARDVTQALVLGGAEGLRQAQLDALAAGAARTGVAILRQEGGAALSELAQRAGPQLEAALAQAIDAAIRSAGAALRQSAERDLAAATQVLVRAATGALIDTIQKKAAESDLGAATTRYAETTLAPAAGLVMRTMMREAMIGLGEGIEEAAQGKDLPLRAAMREIGTGLAEGMRVGVSDNGKITQLLTAGVIVLAGLLVGCLVAALFLWRRYQRTTRSLLLFARRLSESQKADDATLRALREALWTPPPGSREGEAAGEGSAPSLSDPRQSAWLRRFLRRRGIGAAPAKAPDGPSGERRTPA